MATAAWYHGTEDHFGSFDPALIGSQQGRGSPGFWFTNSEHAAGYYGPNIVQCALNLEKPLVVSASMFEEAKRGPSGWARLAQEGGYDAVIIEDVCDGDVPSTVVCIFDHTQISGLAWRVWDDERNCRVAAATPTSRPRMR